MTVAGAATTPNKIRRASSDSGALPAVATPWLVRDSTKPTMLMLEWGLPPHTAPAPSQHSDFQDICFFVFHQLVDLADEVVVQLLQLALGVLDIVLGDFVELLEAIARIGARVSHADAAFFRELVHDFHEIFAALLVERRDRDADHTTLCLRVELQVRLANGLLDRVRLPFVPGRDQQQSRLG